MARDNDRPTTEQEFTRRLNTLLEEARKSGVVTDGTWSIPPYEVVITQEEVVIRSDDEEK